MNEPVTGLSMGDQPTAAPELSVVIPVFNEAGTISELYRRLSGQLDEITPGYEILFVDDGSTDASLPLLFQLHDRDPRVKIVSFTRNFGHQAALTAGLEHASGRAVVCMDGDLQDPPEVIGTLVEKWRDGFEVVYAIRRKRKDPVFKRAAYRAFYSVQARLALDGLFSFSGFPLRLVSVVGVVTSVLSAIGITVVLYFRIFTDRAIPGWAATVIPVLLLGSVQLLALGILGEYVIRIFEEVKRRPVYLVDRKIGFDVDSTAVPDADEVSRHG